MQRGLQGKPILRKIGRFMADMAIFQVQGPYSHMQSGASPGSSVGDTNDLILFLWFILIVFCGIKWHVCIPNEAFLVVKSALGPHWANPPHIHMKQEKSAIFSRQGVSMEPDFHGTLDLV